jgi:putative transposase
VQGRKRHIVVDTQGWLVSVKVHPANWQDKVGLPYVLRRVPLFDRWKLLLLDGGYDSPALVNWIERLFGVRVELVCRPPEQQGFAVLPKRWIVERTFAWLGKCRRLSKDYEHLPQTSENWIYLSMIHLMLKRLCRN